MNRLYESIGKAEAGVAKYLLFILSALVFAAAVARTFRYPINWAVDAATFLFAWCVFLGGDIAIRKDKLFCITVLTDKLPQKAQAYMRVLNYGIIGAFLAGMIVYGSWLSVTTRQRAFQGIPGFSYTWVTLSVPVGCLLMLVSSIRKIRELVQAIRTGAVIQKKESDTEII